MFYAYRRIPFPEDFIIKRIKHGNQRAHTHSSAQPKEISSLSRRLIAKLFHPRPGWCCFGVGDFSGAAHPSSVSSAATSPCRRSGNPELTSIPPPPTTEKNEYVKIAIASSQSRSEHFHEKRSEWRENLETADLLSPIRSLTGDKQFVKNVFQTRNH